MDVRSDQGLKHYGRPYWMDGGAARDHLHSLLSPKPPQCGSSSESEEFLKKMKAVTIAATPRLRMLSEHGPQPVMATPAHNLVDDTGS